MPHRRSVGRLEEKLARNYCHQHSVRAGYDDPGALKELVFDGDSEDVAEEVLAQIGPNRTGEIPDYPQGMVLHSGDGKGAFD